MTDKVRSLKMVVARPSKLEEAYFHENTVADKSLTFFLQPLLDQISLRLPAWISPNLITMCAGFLIISMAALFILHLPDMHGPVSAWMCAVGIIGVLGFVVGHRSVHFLFLLAAALIDSS